MLMHTWGFTVNAEEVESGSIYLGTFADLDAAMIEWVHRCSLTDERIKEYHVYSRTEHMCQVPVVPPSGPYEAHRDTHRREKS